MGKKVHKERADARRASGDYDPQTGKDTGTESYRPSDFDRHN